MVKINYRGILIPSATWCVAMGGRQRTTLFMTGEERVSSKETRQVKGSKKGKGKR